ncbi:MAG: PLP-dependent transferase, partial [Rhizobiaceae bacterium]
MDGRDPRTIAAANGIASDTNFGAVTPPLYLSSTYAFTGFEAHRGYEYSRTANPGRDLLADTLAQLEGGAGAVVTASGMSAVDLVLSLVGRDDLVVAPHDCYGGTYKPLNAIRKIYADKGIDGSKPVITYCRIGERSSHTWFALKRLLGYDAR